MRFGQGVQNVKSLVFTHIRTITYIMFRLYFYIYFHIHVNNQSQCMRGHGIIYVQT